MTWALAARAEAAGNIKLAKELVERARRADALWARNDEGERLLAR